MKRLSIAFAAAATFAALALTPASAAPEVTLRLHTFMPPVANPVKHFLIPWAKKIEDDSHGKIKVQIYPAMQLGGKAEQLLQQVRDGVVDIVWTLPGYTPGVMPKLDVFELPFVHSEPYSTDMALQDFQAKYLKDELKDYHPLLLHVHYGYMFMTTKPIKKLEDFKGLKLRAASRIGGWMIQDLGAAAVQTALPDLAPMMSKGTIDGSMLPYEIAPAVKMQDLANYFTDLAPPQQRLGTTVFAFLMNKNSYNKLSPELKKVIDDNSGRNLAPFAAKVWVDIENAGGKVMHSKTKNVFESMSPQETERVKKALQPVFARFKDEMKKSNIDGDALLTDARAMIAKYKK